jgi:hypothetical protein
MIQLLQRGHAYSNKEPGMFTYILALLVVVFAIALAVEDYRDKKRWKKKR